MKKRILFFLLLTMLVPGFEVIAKSRPLAYKKALKQATRRQELYQREDFHASIKWSATKLDAHFLDAWAREHAKIYNLSDADQAAFRAQLEADYAGYETYFVNFYSYNFRESDLTLPKSVWHLRLLSSPDERDGVAPVRIQKISKPDSYLKRIFPYIDMWSSHCYVFFPKTSDSVEKPYLGVFGPTGQGQLSWARSGS